MARFITLLAVLLIGGSALAGPPAVVRSEPAAGASGVKPDIGVVRVVFDRNMKQNGWSLVLSDRGEFPPIGENAARWVNATEFELAVGPLKPDTAYAIQLNSMTRKGFRSAQEDEPLPETVICFRTAAANEAPVIAGRWRLVREEKEMEIVLDADGTFSQTFRGPEYQESFAGTWEYVAGTLKLTVEGDPEPLCQRCRQIDANTLELENEEGGTMRLTRVADATPPEPPVPPDPEPVEPAAANYPPPAFNPATGTESGGVPGLTVRSPAPDWIRAGTQLTFHTASAVLTGDSEQYVIDKDGRWEDSSGKSYRKEQDSGGGSHGLLQANIVAMDAAEAAVQMIFYLFEGADRTALLNLETGFVAPAATGGDLWMHQDSLRQLLANPAYSRPLRPHEPGMFVSAIPHTIEKVTYQAVRIIVLSPAGRGIWIYDLASGVLLYSSSVAQGTPSFSDTGAQMRAGVTTMRHTTFVGSRDLALPWASGPLPSWFGAINQFSYGGQFNIFMPNTPPTPLPVNLEVRVKRRGAGWLLTEVVSKQTGSGPGGPGLPELSARVAGTCQIGGLWVPAQVLANLRQGQELDRDPFTNFVTVVGAVDSENVVISRLGPRQQQVDLTYRRTNGMLVRLTKKDQNPLLQMTSVLDLYLTGSR